MPPLRMDVRTNSNYRTALIFKTKVMRTTFIICFEKHFGIVSFVTSPLKGRFVVFSHYLLLFLAKLTNPVGPLPNLK